MNLLWYTGVFFALCFGFIYSQRVSREEEMMLSLKHQRGDEDTTSPLLDTNNDSSETVEDKKAALNTLY